jgi:hypothetical protein
MRLLADCRWMSRVALFSVCASYAILRSQFALVFRDLGYAESQFGMYLTICAAYSAAFGRAGRGPVAFQTRSCWWANLLLVTLC